MQEVAEKRLRPSVRSLSAPVDGAFLAVFRLVLGLSFCCNFAAYLSESWVEYFYVSPAFHFKYFGFEWVHPMSGNGMRVVFQIGFVLALMVAAGAMYRVSSISLALVYSYIFLLDKSQYQNHYYLLLLTAWLMALLPAHRVFSLDRLLFRRTKWVDTVPAWTLWLIRFQVALPYFFGGIAKANSDWILGQPMRMKLSNSTWYPILGPWFTEEWCVQLFVWGGLMLDLLIVPLLIWKRTRLPAFFLAVSFHLMNATLFSIGVFPWFMIFATMVYFEPDWPRVFAIRRRPGATGSLRQPAEEGWLNSRFSMAVLGCYVAVQLLLPWRHFLYPGNVNWTEEGHFFAWHMKLRDKKSVCKFKWRDRISGETSDINILQYITPQQASHATGDPEMIVQLSRFLQQDLKKSLGRDCEIYVLTLTSLNGRKPQTLVNPAIDLAAVPRTLFLPDEVLTDLLEPLRPYNPWKIPRENWTEHIEVPDRQFWLGADSRVSSSTRASAISRPVNQDESQSGLHRPQSSLSPSTTVLNSFGLSLRTGG